MSCTDNKKTESKVEVLPYYIEATFTPHWLSIGDSSIADLHQVSSFSLTNQEGNEVTEKSFEDKIYITDFFFTICPGICPKMTKNMAILQDEFLEDDKLIVFTKNKRGKVEKTFATNRGDFEEGDIYILINEQHKRYLSLRFRGQCNHTHFFFYIY